MSSEINKITPEKMKSKNDIFKDVSPKEKLLVKRGKITIILGAILIYTLVFFGIYYFYMGPNTTKANELELGIFETRQAVENMKKELTGLRVKNQESVSLTPEEQELYNKLPEYLDVPDLIRDLNELTYLAADSRLDDVYLQSFSLSTPTLDKKNDLFKTTINASVSSYSFSLYDFLIALEDDSHRVFNVKNISISLVERQDEELDIFERSSENTQYLALLKKRANAVLNSDESALLKKMQENIMNEYWTLKNRSNISEIQTERLNLLANEVDKILTERTYNLSLETFSQSVIE